MTGQQIARYELLGELGRGAMGVVYKARDLRLHRTVALKVLAPGKVADPESRRRLPREARTASTLNHVNIVTVYDIDTWDGADFIAMEYVVGESLQDLIESRCLSFSAATDYAVQITEGLGAAHAAGVIHRDLKPSNIMVSSNGLVKILDFGLATGRQPFVESVDDSTASFDPPGTLCGTAPYMAPEQIEGRSADAQIDIFAFGVVLYEMITHSPAFRRDTAAATFGRSYTQSFRPSASLEPRFPPVCSTL
jgi:serine/threonine protein kinase